MTSIITAIHLRIEEVLPIVLESKTGHDLEHFQSHIKCKPKSYHVTLGANNRDGEVVIFDRYCGCKAGVLHGELPRACFEDDAALKAWVSGQLQKAKTEEYEDKRRRFEHYKQLREEFKYLDG